MLSAARKKATDSSCTAAVPQGIPSCPSGQHLWHGSCRALLWGAPWDSPMSHLPLADPFSSSRDAQDRRPWARMQSAREAPSLVAREALWAAASLLCHPVGLSHEPICPPEPPQEPPAPGPCKEHSSCPSSGISGLQLPRL